jgi:hypothetical protein
MFNEDYLDDTTLSQAYYLEGKKIEKIPDTEEEAWNRAKQGYLFPPFFSIASLSELDLVEIAQYEPFTTLEEYKRLQGLSRVELLRRVPGLEILYPTISKSDVFFYLTRGWLPQDTNAKEKVNRYNLFMHLTPSIQQLFYILYPTAKDFAMAFEPTDKPLGSKIEFNLLLYDQWLGLPSTPYIITKNLGIYLSPQDEDIYISFLSVIEAYLRSASENSSTIPIDFQQVVEMSSSDWNRFQKQENISIPYERRTDYVMRVYYKVLP